MDEKKAPPDKDLKAWARAAVADLVEQCRVAAVVKASRESRRLAKLARAMRRQP